MEKVVETKICKHCGATYHITDKDLDFFKKIGPTFNGKKFIINPSDLCSECKQKNRLCFRNEQFLYKTKCDYSGKEIVSQYSEDKKLKVYSLEVYNSDLWWPVSESFDFSKNVFSQFEYLLKNTAKSSLLSDLISYQNNSKFQNGSSRNKNCYYVFCAGDNQDCIYGYNVDYSIKCLDNDWIRGCNNCYGCIDSNDCINGFYLDNCIDCFNSHHCYDCMGCSFCFGCAGLRNKSYYFLNKKLSRNDYLKLIANLNYEEFYENYKNLLLYSIRKFSIIEGSENCNGNFIYNSKFVKNSTKVYDCENCSNSSKIVNCKYCYDLDSWGDSGEMIYNCITVGKDSYNCFFSNNCWPYCLDIFYCDSCNSCENCFLCTGLKNKSYCILNKQYTKEEYNELVPKIIEHMMSTGEWGEFFPSSLSPFGYNETVAQEYFPLSREEAINNGFNWSDHESPKPKVDKVIPASKLPRNIKDIPDDILNWAIECELTGKPFRIIKEELEFYRKHNLPIPRRHPDRRHLDRIKLRNPRKLYDRLCDKCGVDIKTTYSPKRPEIVYCENCYEKQVY